MMIRNALLLAWDNIIGRAVISVAMIVICAVSFYVFDEAASEYFEAREAIDNYANAWEVDTDRVCQVQLTYLQLSDRNYGEMLTSFLNQLDTLEGVSEAGCFYYLTEKFRIDGDEMYIEVLYISPGLLQMKEITQNNPDSLEDGELVCFVGENLYHALKEQNTIKNSTFEEIRVSGKLNKNANWFSNSGISAYRDFIQLDDCLVIPKVQITDDTTAFSCLNSMYVILGERDDYDVAKKSVQNLANACGFSATITTEDDLGYLR